MTEFTKTKIHFALALLGSLFALHPYLEKFQDAGFTYLGYFLKVSYAYLLLAGLLAFCVYCFGLALVSERPHSWLEKLGNYSYGLAVMVLPFFGGLYLASLLADKLGQSHLQWAAPSVALGLGVAWFVLSQVFALMLRGRLGKQDQQKKIEQLARQEVASLGRASELFAAGHVDLAVIEAWRAVEARLRRALLNRGIAPAKATPDAIVRAARKAGILREPALGLMQTLRKQWDIAISNEPLARDAASSALDAARQILSMIPLPDLAQNTGLAGNLQDEKT
jgi:HEPN domain-containing protein